MEVARTVHAEQHHHGDVDPIAGDEIAVLEMAGVDEDRRLGREGDVAQQRQFHVPIRGPVDRRDHRNLDVQQIRLKMLAVEVEVIPLRRGGSKAERSLVGRTDRPRELVADTGEDHYSVLAIVADVVERAA